MEEFQKVEMAKRQLKAERLQKELMEGKLSETSIKVVGDICAWIYLIHLKILFYHSFSNHPNFKILCDVTKKKEYRELGSDVEYLLRHCKCGELWCQCLENCLIESRFFFARTFIAD